ncbi:unnamed protein product [Adineta steineri]|uniref:Phosphorylase b kinase regulatory subunit n=1 Tax=Adineta steineri TaxID=433720 RepID=A0A815FZT4_9BILA|nr:unnamed protein product [Adineta steineri]
MITQVITDDEDGTNSGVLDLSIRKRLPVLLSPPSSTVSSSSSSSSSSITSPKRILPTGKRMLDSTISIPSSTPKTQPTNKRPLRFQCKHCDYKAPSTSLMQNHIYRHTDLTPYACAYCGHKSTTKSTIMVHIELCHPNMEVKIHENRVREQDFYRDLNSSEITAIQEPQIKKQRQSNQYDNESEPINGVAISLKTIIDDGNEYSPEANDEIYETDHFQSILLPTSDILDNNNEQTTPTNHIELSSSSSFNFKFSPPSTPIIDTALSSLANDRKESDSEGRAHELGQAAVKCMRGILICWMNQSKKLEVFKGEQSPKDALHSKFNVIDGSEIEGIDEVGQLQICAISIYLLTLAQMITSNLEIIFSIDEVNFVQQLVFSIERAYRTPDYGIWERGSKYNTNTCELHASSIGMAKAALEAMNGFNLYGERGASWSVVYVDVDAHNRNRITFDTLLPRESASKNTDAALLLTVGWPTFAVHDATLVDNTVRKCIRKLRGTHGFKRFLRDGQYTDLESTDQRFYQETEIKKFDKNECEWPMFFALMAIDGIFKNNSAQVDEYLTALNPLLRRTTEVTPKKPCHASSRSNNSELNSPKPRDMMVHYYYVDHLKQQNSSQSDSSNRNNDQQRTFSCSAEVLHGKYFLFGQSIWIICQLLSTIIYFHLFYRLQI